MALKDKITTGMRNSPPRIVMYGTNGIGKSTTAAQSPSPIFIPTEDGLDQIDCAAFSICKTFDAIMAAIGDLYNESHEFRTVVVDSLDWLEQLVWDSTCKRFGVNCIEKVDGGYAKGYTHALHEWRQVREGLDALRNERGMAVILLAHAKVEKFEDPESTSYDRYSPRVHKHASAMWCEWADAVLFANVKTRVQTEDAGFNRERGIAVALGANGGERILKTVVGPTCVAKNRYGMPPEIPLSWPAIADAMT